MYIMHWDIRPGSAVTLSHADENFTLSRLTWPLDETKISSGVSQSRKGDESIEIVQYI
jgi:hypothetical protein